ncbi:MAG: thiol reductant ABC exporter subunit CydD [Alicyclobacillus sp.]|nr:thiol reductant ABC exporter subunit CydD [Alicyclobacillus sp.]
MDRRLFPWLRRASGWFVGTTSLGILNSLLMIVQAALLARVIDAVFLHHAGLAAVLPQMVWWLSLAAVRGACLISGEWMGNRMAVVVKHGLRQAIVQKLFDLGPVYIGSARIGELATVATQGVEELDAYVSRYLPQAILSCAVPFAVACFVATEDLLSAAILFVTAPMVVVFMILLGKAAQRKNDRVWRLLTALGGQFLDVLKGLPTLKLFQRSEAQLAIIKRMSETYRATAVDALRIAFLSSFALELFTTLGTAVVAVALGLRLLHGTLAFPLALTVLFLTPEFYAPIRLLGTQYHAGMKGISAMNDITDVLSLDGPRDGATSVLWTASPGRGVALEFHKVCVVYPGAIRAALQDVSFRIEAGEMIAIVGPSGAGKSTLLDVLQRYIDPVEGVIRINGQPLHQLDVASWRTQVASVSQQVYLFHGTIEENIRLARPGASFAQVLAAARAACAEPFIRELPDGFRTVVGEGGRGLSGGQAQRIALARLLLKDAPLVLLDEPTAHLDVESERAIQEALSRLRGTRTVLVVAHRLSTVQRADRVLVLKDGRLAEFGKPQKLLRSNGLYQTLTRAYGGEW